MIDQMAEAEWTEYNWPAHVRQELTDFGAVELPIFAETYTGSYHCGCPVCGAHYAIVFPKEMRTEPIDPPGVTIGVGCSVCGQCYTLLSATVPIMAVRTAHSFRNVDGTPDPGLPLAVGDRVRVRPQHQGYHGRLRPFTSRITAIWWHSGATWVQVLQGWAKTPIHVRAGKVTRLEPTQKGGGS